MQQCKQFASLTNKPLIICVESNHTTVDEQLIHFSQKAGALFLDNIGEIFINNKYVNDYETKIINNISALLIIKNNLYIEINKCYLKFYNKLQYNVTIRCEYL